MQILFQNAIEREINRKLSLWLNHVAVPGELKYGRDA